MDNNSLEQALRREAVRRRLQGERRCHICRDLNRSSSWFDKWWVEYQRHPTTDLADRSRAPQRRPSQTPAAVKQAICSIRRWLENGRAAETRYGLIGHRAIGDELQPLSVKPVASLTTIQRVLAGAGLTHPPGVAAETAIYPELTAWMPNAIHATDMISKHLYGGQVVQSFHTFDHYTHAVYLSQHRDKTSATARAHLLGVGRNWDCL